MSNLNISISAEPIFHLGNFTVTNSMLTSVIVTGSLILFAYIFNSKLKQVSYTDKPNRFQSLIEAIIDAVLNLTSSTAETYQKTRAFFPFVATFFLFIIFSNWSGLIPGVGVIGFREPAEVEAVKVTETKNDVVLVEEKAQLQTTSVPAEKTTEFVTTKETEKSLTQSAGITGTQTPESENPTEVTTPEKLTPENSVFVPFFRAPTADINTTLALALFSIVTVQIIGVKFSGWSYFKKFINFSSPIYFAVGILEIFSELSGSSLSLSVYLVTYSPEKSC